MSLEFILNFLSIFQIIDNNTATLMSADANGVTISTKRDGGQRHSHINLLDFFAFNDVKEMDLGVEAS